MSYFDSFYKEVKIYYPREIPPLKNKRFYRRAEEFRQMQEEALVEIARYFLSGEFDGQHKTTRFTGI